MSPLPLTPEMMAIARRLVWFEAPEQALSDPVRFMAYAMARADAADMAEIRRHVSDGEFAYAIEHAPPGIIDPRSWWYWNLIIRGRQPPPAMPVRRLDTTSP